MIVAGIMSGNSAGGVDVALTRINPTRTTPPSVSQLAFLGHDPSPTPNPSLKPSST